MYTVVKHDDVQAGRLFTCYPRTGHVYDWSDALGSAMDGMGAVEEEDRRSLESPAPSIMDRRSVHEPFATGITAIDAMIPIGRGQRELIIGDRQTGKTTAAVDAILNQTDVLCVYVAVGQKNSTVAEMLSSLATQKDLSTKGLIFYLRWMLSDCCWHSSVKWACSWGCGP